MRVVKHQLPRYGVAVVTTAIASLMALWLSPLNLRVPFALFAAAVLVSSLEGGLKPGLLATGLATAALGVEYWLLPLSQFAENQAEVAPLLALFILVGLLSSYLGQRCWQAVHAVARQAESQRRQREQPFRSLAACAPIGILQMDLQGRCVYMNCACQLLGGFSAEEGFDQGWTRFVHIEDRDWAAPAWTRAMQAGQEFACEFRFQPSEQDVRWVRLHSTPMYSERGKMIGHVGILQDIADRKLLEEALEETRTLLSVLVDESTDPLFVKNRITSVCRQITEETRLRAELAQVNAVLERQVYARQRAEEALQAHQAEQQSEAEMDPVIALLRTEPSGIHLLTNGKPEAVEVP
jgi:PAS domain S-box-containing protein